MRWSQLRTGAILLLALTGTLTAIFFSDAVMRELSEGPELMIAATEASGLEAGSGVWVAGVPAGRVRAVRFREPGSGERPVVIRAVLREDAAETVRADASARIRASALLAPSVVAVDPGRSDRAFDFRDTLRTEERLDQQDVRARADSLARALRGLAPLADSLGGRLTEGPGTLAALRRDEALRGDLDRLAAALEGVLERIPRGTAARLAADTAVRASLGRTMDRLRALAERAPRLEARRDSFRRRLDALTGRLERLGARLDSADGTAGRLLHDGALRRERRRLDAQMDSLVVELLADPLRWIRFRLF